MPTESKKRSRADTQQEDTTPKKKQQIASVGSDIDALLGAKSKRDPDQVENFRVITGTYERILYGINAYWEKTSGKFALEPVFIVPAHTGCIRTVAMGGTFLASGSTDEIIRLYDVKKRKEYGSLGGHHSGDISDIQFYGKYMLSASEDKTICLWRTKDWEYLKTLKGHKGRVNSLAVHPSGKIALSVSSDRTVMVWNLMTARKASSNKLYKEGLIVLWNSGGSQYAILFDREINIYNVANADVLTTMKHGSRFLCMRYFKAKDGKDYIVSGHEDKSARIWDTSSGECVRELTGHKLRVKALSVVETTKEDEPVSVLTTVSSDGMIKCWDLDAAVAGDVEPIGEYNTKSRATCCVTHTGFSKTE